MLTFVWLILAGVAGGLLAWLLLALVRWNQAAWIRSLLPYLSLPLGVTLFWLGVLIAAGVLLHGADQSLLALPLIVSLTWSWTRFTAGLEAWAASRYEAQDPHSLEARRLHTRLAVLRRILNVIVLVLAVALVLMSIPSVRVVGESLLASAGVVGLVGGLAAQSLLANLIAGVQIALTEPIRLEDVVIANGEWGWIEEITATYVVVRIWDLRRMILPLTYFIQQPFQNWTYRSPELLGYVHLHVDYRTDLDDLRRALKEILEQSELWDGKVWNLQVVGSDASGLELRALFSAPDSGTRWDLSVWVRERLYDHLQKRYPEALPRTRVELAPQGVRS
jgi:small-conductance mechanosensitive channel